MKELKLLVVGTPGRKGPTVWDDVAYVTNSRYADKAEIMSYGVRTDNSTAIANSFCALCDPMYPDDTLMKVFHFVLFAKQTENLELTLMHGAFALADWFSGRGHQILLVPHDGGTNCGVRRHWHALINPYSTTGLRFLDREEDYNELLNFLNQDTGMSWSLGFSEIRRNAVPSPFVEVYDPNDI